MFEVLPAKNGLYYARYNRTFFSNDIAESEMIKTGFEMIKTGFEMTKTEFEMIKTEYMKWSINPFRRLTPR